jgi:hypothetical protein
VSTKNKALVGDLPIILSQSIPTALVKYKREDFAASYAIGNTPWLSAASDQNRITRVTTTYQKERIDQGTSAGENSLSNWWLRSATSWHHGAGETYYDADSSDLYKFFESNNIDVWTKGNLSLLKRTTQATTSSVSNPVTVSGGTFYLQGTTLKFYNQSADTHTTITLPGAGNIPYCITSDGTYCLVAATDGIYDVTTAGVVRTLWDKPNYVAATWFPQTIAYIKERIVVAALEGTVEVGIYEISRSYITPTPRINASNERWETSNTSTVVNSITELNSAIIAGYTQGAISRVISFAIDLTNPLAAINEPNVIAELPRGETLNQMRMYLNEYVALGTSKGIRIGNQSSDGTSFTLGALVIEEEVQDISFDSNYIYATKSTQNNDQNYGLWRIDIGVPLDVGYAYASDLEVGSGTVTGVAFIGTSSRKFITTTSGVYLEHATELSTTGTINSGFIRWGTAERKQPVSLAVRAEGSGTVGFAVADQDGNQFSVDSIPVTGATEVQLSAGLQPADHFGITLTLTRNTSDVTTGPVIEEWQCRALPSPLRSRTITIPLLCYEEERDANGVTNVTDPWERIRYLERVEQNGGAVLFQDFSSGEERVCVIRAIQFEQVSPPTFAKGFGGIVTVQLQTIDTEQAVQ